MVLSKAVLVHDLVFVDEARGSLKLQALVYNILQGARKRCSECGAVRGVLSKAVLVHDFVFVDEARVGLCSPVKSGPRTRFCLCGRG